MGHGLVDAALPTEEIFRVGWHRDPLGPPPWEKALADGTFGNRFDDPSAAEGRSPEERFRCIYLGTTAEAAFGETLDQFRVSIEQLNIITAAVENAESIEDILGDVLDLENPNIPRGIVPVRWRNGRKLATTTLDPNLRIADLGTHAGLQHLQYELSGVAASLGLSTVDFPAIMDKKNRRFTQACARYIYELRDIHDAPLYHGIRYLSRLDVDWECWALFEDRINGLHRPGYPEPITASHPALCSVARRFNLSIEMFEGSQALHRP